MIQSVDPHRFDAALFDMDGVITNTAIVHEAAWTDAFAPVLSSAEEPPFTHEDYRLHVDGKPRKDGIRAFLLSRNIGFDDVLVDTIAKDKNAAFLQRIDERGVAVLPGAVDTLAQFRLAGLKLGLFTASRNAPRVLAKANLAGLFDAVVDGAVATKMGLSGKPQPDVPLACAAQLGVTPARCILFEDAVAGIKAGLAGHFGQVVGISGEADAKVLRDAGAQTIVRSLADVALLRAYAPPRACLV
ncbi:MAG: beta-phosphoglucomutase family hydrolase [Pseudomonadota bacterium]